MSKAVCCVFDSAVQAFSQPFFTRAVGEALRSFTDEVNRADAANALYQHPEDYTLYVLAMFDDELGTFTEAKRVLARGQDVVKGDKT